MALGLVVMCLLGVEEVLAGKVVFGWKGWLQIGQTCSGEVRAVPAAWP